MINAVSHIGNLEPVFREARRVIENNGAFLVNFPNLLSPYFPFGLYVNLRGRALVRNVYTR